MFMDSGDDTLKRRLAQYSKSGPKQKGYDEKEETDFIEFLWGSVTNLSKTLTSNTKAVLTQKQLLLESGLAYDDEAIIKHTKKKIRFAFILSALSVFLAFTGGSDPIMKILTLVIGPVLGFRYPDIKLKTLAKKRATEITYSLPDAIDLLTVCVEAGLGLDSAISRVAAEQKKSSPILSGEFDRVTKDILAGIPRTESFRNLIKRNGSQELRSFVGLLIQSDKLGTSIAQSLKVYSDALRVKRRQRAEQLAAQAGVKMSLPLVLFILPATFIVILAPAGISMYKMFTGGGL